MRRGLSEECWGAASGVATRTVSSGNARARFASMVSSASGAKGTRLTRRLLVTAVEGEEARSILVCAEAIVRCVDFPGIGSGSGLEVSVSYGNFCVFSLCLSIPQKNHSCTHPMGLPLHLKRCAPGCMWLLAEGMQSPERGPRIWNERRMPSRCTVPRLEDYCMFGAVKQGYWCLASDIDRLIVLSEPLFGGRFCRGRWRITFIVSTTVVDATSGVLSESNQQSA